jgi:hypothetical protein
MVELSDLIGPARIWLNIDIRYSPDSTASRGGSVLVFGARVGWDGGSIA